MSLYRFDAPKTQDGKVVEQDNPYKYIGAYGFVAHRPVNGFTICIGEHFIEIITESPKEGAEICMTLSNALKQASKECAEAQKK